MPKLFNIGSYCIFFWSNDNDEPIHVHISKSKPTENATKIWITKRGGYIVAHNRSRIPQKDLNDILAIINGHFFFICREWKHYFSVEEIDFYC